MSDPHGLFASTSTVPLYYSPSSSPQLDGHPDSAGFNKDHHHHSDDRLSFPASVHARASVGAHTDVGDFMLSNRDSMRGPPPPLPPKPPKLAVTSTGVGGAPPAGLQYGGFVGGGGWPGPSSGSLGGGLMAPQARNDRRPSEVLDLSMFAEQSPPQQYTTSPSSPHLQPHSSSASNAAPFPSRTPSPNPFPSRTSSAAAPFGKKPGPAIPPRPGATNPFPSFELKPSTSGSNLTGLGFAASNPDLRSPQSPPPDHTTSQISSEMSSMSLSSVGSSSVLPPPPVHHARDTSANGSVRSMPASSSSFNLKDRLAAGVALGRSWANQAAESRQAAKLQNIATSSANALPLPTRSTPSPCNDAFPPPTPHGTEIKLPATILGVRVPRAAGVAFGVDLEFAVASTHVPSDGLVRSVKERMDEVQGDEARMWLPAIAFRCLQYLEHWARTEEGIFRVPGRSNLVAQLRALYDAGCDLDLRDIHPADLEPHAVASLFKSWLRDIPDSLLSPHLESTIDELTVASVGFTATAASFLAPQQKPAAGGATGLVDGRAPREYLEQLRELFAVSMPAEHFVLLRAVAYHLARVSSCAAVNKMSISNLKLILSPTLRLSPLFLEILVSEREILFSRANESSRQRRGSEAPSLVSPNMGSSPRFGQPASSNPTSPNLGSNSGSSRNSPNPAYRKPPPTTYLTGPTVTSPSHDKEEWLVVSSPDGGDQYATVPPALAASVPVPPSPASSTGSRRTPIADKFTSTFSSSMTDLHSTDTPPSSARLSPSAASVSSFASDTLPAAKPYIPARGAPNTVGGFYSKRDELPSRKGSAGSASSANATLAPSQERRGSTASDRAHASKSPVRRRNAVTSGGALASFRQPLPDDAEQQEELAPEQADGPSPSRGRQPSVSGSAGGSRDPSASPTMPYLHRPSVDSTYSNASTVEEATISTGKREVLTHEAPSLSLSLPTIGLGVAGERKSGGEDDWGGLLSVSERKKLFGG